MNLKKLKTSKTFFKFSSKRNYKIFISLIVIYSVYCSLTIGEGWDEVLQLWIGKNTLDYLFSMGKIDNAHLYREYLSPIYWSLNYFLTQIFPFKYQIEASHLINLTFSLSAIIGIGKLSKELFNQKVGKFVFLILFFYPIFFGHMSFNSKDVIVAFCHVWIFYLIIRYIKKQNVKDKVNKYIIFLGLLSALGMGVYFIFLGSLITIFFFFIIEIFIFKRFLCKNFNIIKLCIDIGKIFLVFYFLIVLFWIDTHENILVLPINYFTEYFSYVAGEAWRGWPYNLLNGKYYLSSEVPKLHFLINLIYKSPEYFLLCYVIFLIIFIKSNTFFTKKIQFFNYKIILIISVMIIPFLIGFIIPVVIYDGMRHFLWVLPYFCIIPGLTFYYLFENLNLLRSKLTLIVLSFFIVYFLFNFFLITPYHYTYLNMFNGKIENRYQKFENDYWASSLGELIKNSSFDKTKTVKFSTCGVPASTLKNYLIKRGYTNFSFLHPEEADFIIMTNRVTFSEKVDNIADIKLINCFDKYEGDDIFQVKRAGLLLSVIRRITK